MDEVARMDVPYCWDGIVASALPRPQVGESRVTTPSKTKDLRTMMFLRAVNGFVKID